MSNIIGIIIALGLIYTGMVLEHADMEAMVGESAALIVFGGIIGVSYIAYPLKHAIRLPYFIFLSFLPNKIALKQTILDVVRAAQKRQMQGVTGLASEVALADDKFIKKGLKLIMGGNVNSHQLDTILERDIHEMKARHNVGIGMLKMCGGYGPTMGMIGTIIGMIMTLGNIADTSKLGPSIAIAMIATLYGVASANLLWLPMASKLHEKSKEEVLCKELAREGMLAIFNGEPSSIVEEKMYAGVSYNQMLKIKGAKADQDAENRYDLVLQAAPEADARLAREHIDEIKQSRKKSGAEQIQIWEIAEIFDDIVAKSQNPGLMQDVKREFIKGMGKSFGEKYFGSGSKKPAGAENRFLKKVKKGAPGKKLPVGKKPTAPIRK